MARNQADREDLLREATALIERAELRIPAESESIVAGFRRDGSASFYFGSDPVYQFNSAGELRRAYVAGRLLKAEQGRLVALTRERTASEVALVRCDLPQAEQDKLLRHAQSRLQSLAAALIAGEFRLIGQVPARGDVVARLRQWLRAPAGEIVVARRPNVR
jgi:hypothetical protein